MSEDPAGISSTSPGPKSVRVEGMGDSSEHSLPDQIARDRYIRANNTAGQGFFGIRRVKFRPHGSVLPPGRWGGG